MENGSWPSFKLIRRSVEREMLRELEACIRSRLFDSSTRLYFVTLCTGLANLYRVLGAHRLTVANMPRSAQDLSV